MEFLEGLKNAWKFIGGDLVDEAWASNEVAFEEHFGVSYEEFEGRVANLDQAHSQLYERTLEINPEAAITWVFFLT